MNYTDEQRNALDWFIGLQGKYNDLVSYARYQPKDDPYYKTIDPKITQSVLNHMAKTEEMFPDECDRISGADGNFYHGYNSGILAATNFIMETILMNNPKGALDDFPQLDT